MIEDSDRQRFAERVENMVKGGYRVLGYAVIPGYETGIGGPMHSARRYHTYSAMLHKELP